MTLKLNYGPALGVLATSHTFSAHMGWEDMETAVPIAERAALAATLGRITRSAVLIYSRGISATRWRSSIWRCGSIRISLWRKATLV